MRSSASVGLLFVILFGLFSSPAHSQWTVTYLHPAGPLDSFARGTSGVDQVGQAFVSGNYHAARWTGSAASFADLHPAGYVASRLTDADGANQVGAVTPLFIEHAALWSGTAASFVDLHPPLSSDPLSSVATDMGGAIQTGWVTFTASGPTHAARWSSTALSYVDIHPGGDNSVGYGTDGTSIVGQVDAGGSSHAGLWTAFGPVLYTDLNPAGAGSSLAADVDGAIQVGEANFAGSTHAALWSGTAASFVDMTPPGTGGAKLHAIDSGFQVGEAFVGPGASYKAGIWSGTPGSFVNLHSFLTPGTFFSSDAWGVWTDGTTVYVAGSAYNTAFTRSEAVLWSMAIPEPGTLSALAAVGLLALRFRRR